MTKEPMPKSDLPKIFTVLPEEIKDGFPHGQWLFDTPGLVMNFATELDDEFDYLPNLEPMLKRMQDFLSGDELYMAFESPHTPGVNYLHRHAAERIVATQVAWSRKVYARTASNGKGVQLVDEATGVPVIRKLPDRR